MNSSALVQRQGYTNLGGLDAQMNVTYLRTTIPVQNTPPTQPLLHFAMLNSSYNGSGEVSVSAYAVQLNYCLQNISTLVQNGVFQQNISRFPSEAIAKLSNDSLENGDTLWEYYGPNKAPFKISGQSSGALTQFFSGVFNGSLHYNIEGESSWSSDFMQIIWSVEDLPGMINSVATSISTRFRAVSPSLL